MGGAWGRRGCAAVGIAALLLASRARASCCIFEDPLLAIGDASARGGSVSLAAEAEALSSRARMDHGGTAMDERVSQRALRLVAALSPAERLSLVLAVPLVHRTWRADGGAMAPLEATLVSPGDADLAVRWAAWRQVAFVQDPVRIAVTRAQAFALTAGTSVPTGENGARRDGARLPEHAQAGTGAWGPFVGVLYRLEREPWGLSVSATLRGRTENAWAYRFGAAVLAAGDVRRDVAPRLSAGVGLDARWAAPDRVSGAPRPDTGGFLVLAAPALYVGLAPGVQARVRAAIPVVQRLRGEQEAGVALLAGIAFDRR